MSEENPRKASEVILALEAQINVLSKQVANLDTNIKLILNRLATLISVKQDVDSSNLPAEVVNLAENTSNLSELKKNVISNDNVEIKKNQPVQSKKTVETEEEFDFPQVETEKSSVSSGKKVAVQQRIIYPDGKNICLANVELKTKSGEIVKKLRTNAMGKWISTMEPGEYLVHITKSANKTNPDVEITFPVSIPDSDRPIELPSPKV